MYVSKRAPLLLIDYCPAMFTETSLVVYEAVNMHSKVYSVSLEYGVLEDKEFCFHEFREFQE